MRYLLLALILWIGIRAFGLSYPDDSRSMGMGGAGVMLADGMSFISNEASLAVLRNTSFGMIAESPFLVPEMTFGTIFIGVPVKSGSFGFTFSSNGYQVFRQNRTSLSFGKSFGDKFRAGIEIAYLGISQFADYGKLNALIPAVGIQVIPTPRLIIGCHISNPAHQEFYPKGIYRIPVVFRAGAGYSAGNDVLVCFEFRKESGSRPFYCGGFEFACNKLVNLRLGLSSSTYFQYSFGLGIRKDHMTFQMAAVHHPVLGYTPSLTLSRYL